MSFEFIEDTAVEVEYEIETSHVDFKTELLTVDTFDETRSKCGEVFVGHRGGDFSFVCAQCLQTFINLHSFGKHIRDEHPLPKDETIAEDAFELEQLPPKLEPRDEDKSNFGIHGSKSEDNMKEMEIDLIGVGVRFDDFKPTADDMKYTKAIVLIDDRFESANSTLDNMKYTEAIALIDDVNPTDENSSLKSEISNLNRSDETCATFCCYSCGMGFLTFKSYRTHYRTRHPGMIEMDDPDSNEPTSFIPKVPGEMLCKFCLKTFHETSAYHSHMQNKHPKRLYTCPVCPKYFRGKYERNLHIGCHEIKPPSKCPHCSEAFTLEVDLRQHVVNIHSKIRPFSCRFCDKKFARSYFAKLHELSHADERPFRCNECRLNFTDERQMRLHVQEHTSRENDDYRCPHCNKTCLSSTFLQAHILTHLNGQTSSSYNEERIEDQNRIQDSHDQDNFPSSKSESLDGDEDHSELRYTKGRAEMIPSVPKEMICKYCLNTFKNITLYRNHMENEHPLKLYTCPSCSKSFRRKSRRNYHAKSHACKGLFTCPHCYKFLSCSGNLNRHVKLLHSHLLRSE